MSEPTSSESSREIEIRVGIPLSEENERITKVLPSEYVQRTLGEAINYSLNEAELNEREQTTAAQIREEMDAEHILQVKRQGAYINARKDHPLSRYLERDATTGKDVLDIVVAHIDKGGSILRLYE